MSAYHLFENINLHRLTTRSQTEENRIDNSVPTKLRHQNRNLEQKTKQLMERNKWENYQEFTQIKNKMADTDGLHHHTHKMASLSRVNTT